jgi:hypothetical protein
MITKFKIYENINEGEPIGNYVICRTRYSHDDIPNDVNRLMAICLNNINSK